jgi:arylformamidase
MPAMAISPDLPLYLDFTSQEEIDAAYDPTRNVPDVVSIRKGYEELGERARQDLPYLASVPYGPTLDEHVDIFPASELGSPVLLVIHGGYWRSNRARDSSQIALGPHALGMTVVIVNYSLCPKVNLDEITRQVRASVVWTMRHVSKYNGDPKRLLVAGHSAGAHLAAMCLQTRWAEDYGLDAQPIRAALLVSGVYDIAPLRYSYLQPLIQLDEGIVRRNSPMFGICRSDAKVLLTWGSKESTEFSRQSREYCSRWAQMGNSAELLEQKGGDHFTVIHGFEHADSEICRWLLEAA